MMKMLSKLIKKSFTQACLEESKVILTKITLNLPVSIAQTGELAFNVIIQGVQEPSM